MDEAALALHRVLFNRYELRSDLPDEQIDVSHRFETAERFCLRLGREFSNRHKLDALRRCVRDYYRMGLSEKMRAA